MQRAFAVSVAVAVGLMSSGCIFNKAERAPTQQVEAHDGPAWKLGVMTECNAEAGDFCIGKWGFAVTAARQWIAGPGPQGQIATGTLEEAEFRAIEEKVNWAFEAGNTFVSETCMTAEEAEQIEFRGKVVLTRSQQEWTVLRTEEGRVCFQTAKAEAAVQLQLAIEEVAEKYYPAPFPDHCAESVSRVHAIYPELETCSVDADCGYFVDLDPVPATPAQFVVTDSCSRIRPLAVANVAAVNGAKAKLKELIQAAENSCGPRMGRDGCTGIHGFDSSAGAGEAKCVREGNRNVCRMIPAALR